mmetsp:Transcript_123078/g.347828  ORF Transcript_123078/g.347828 Transcript_123078/m.347828 type:complete len:727 (-) Transcript_123078:91-2271(-)
MGCNGSRRRAFGPGRSVRTREGTATPGEAEAIFEASAELTKCIGRPGSDCEVLRPQVHEHEKTAQKSKGLWFLQNCFCASGCWRPGRLQCTNGVRRLGRRSGGSEEFPSSEGYEFNTSAGSSASQRIVNKKCHILGGNLSWRHIRLESIDESGMNKAQPTSSPRKGQSSAHCSDEFDPTFLNHMLEYTWTHISQYFVHIAKTVVEPAVKKALGGLGNRFTIVAEKCELGQEPVLFTKVQTAKAQQRTEEGMLENVVVKTNVEWRSSLKLIASLSGIEIGINYMVLMGVLMIEFVGMVPKPPMFKGARAFFLNPPKIDVGFQGRIMSMLNFDHVKDKICEVLGKQLTQIAVVPNTVGVLFDEEADYFSTLKPRPKGLLSLTICRFSNLHVSDIPGSSNLYVVVQCGAVRFSSETKQGAVEPRFDWTVQFPIASVYHQCVHVELWDGDVIMTDDLLGNVELKVLDMVEWGSEEKSVELQNEQGNVGNHCALHVRAVYMPLLLDSTADRVDGVAHLLCGVYCASNVPWECESTEYWVTASCTHQPCWEMHRTMMSRKEARKRVKADDGKLMEMKRLLQLLTKYSLTSEDLGRLFGVDGQQLKRLVQGMGHGCRDIRLDDLREVQAHAMQDIVFNYPFEFIVGDMSMAVVSLELRSKAPSVEEKVLGTCQYNARDLLAADDCTARPILQLKGISAVLSLKLQVRFLGPPTTSPLLRQLAPKASRSFNGRL